MKRSAATFAIVSARLRRDGMLLVAAAAVCALLAYLQRHDDRYADLAGALVFATIAACASAMLLHARRHRELTLSEEAAPLYGRELARARAILPCVTGALAACAYWAVALFYQPQGAAFIALTAMSATASAMAVLCASVAPGRQRPLFFALGIAAGAISFALCTVPAAGFAAGAAIAYVTLRHYGEAIARG
ncbi:MAG: hypothetical protein ABR508_00360 [Candidatus Baltobacteraceae bacterium]